MKKTTPKKKATSIEARAVAYITADNALLKQHKLAKKLIVSFPNKKRTPLFGKIGMALVRSSGGILDTMFADTKK